MDKILRRLRNLPLRLIGNVLLLVGIALLGVASLSGHLVSMEPTPVASPARGPALRTPWPAYTPVPTAQATGTASLPGNTIETPEPAAPPTRLVIPALEVDAPVVELPVMDKTWDMSGLTHEIAHLGGTANPGESSNMVLAGHVTLRIGAGPFLHLERLKPGDTAIVYAGDEAYTYRVITKKYVSPDDVSVTYRTSEPILTLITCTSWDAENRAYNQRVAVVAGLVKERLPARSRSRMGPQE